jgi:hypothetical protein
MVMLVAPMDLSVRMSCVSVSLCVEPGKGSAVLKFGLSSTSFPFTGLMPSSSTARLMPLARSAVLIQEIFVCPFLDSRCFCVATSVPPHASAAARAMPAPVAIRNSRLLKRPSASWRASSILRVDIIYSHRSLTPQQTSGLRSLPDSLLTALIRSAPASDSRSSGQE